jgi:phosphoglycolate phosphatase
MAWPLKLIVFDVDGTLVDSQHVIISTAQAAFERFGLPRPDDDAVRRIIGLPLAEGLARLAPMLDEAQVEDLARAYRETFQAARAMPELPETLFPGVVAMLEAVAAAGFALGIATGKSRRGLLSVLERHGLARFFCTLQTGDVPPGKPHPAMLLRALDECGVTPAEAAMIGDTTFDIAMACAAGTLPIGVAWGNHPAGELTAAGAAYVVETSEAIAPLLAGLTRR